MRKYFTELRFFFFKITVSWTPDVQVLGWACGYSHTDDENESGEAFQEAVLYV